MKHLLNYYREQTLNNGDKVRLELYREYPDDWSIYPLTREIGDVLAGLHLDIEGGMDDIDTPIVKTSLTFSVVDAPDKDNPNIKTSHWEEFYTTSATGWKVVLLGKKPNAAQFTPMWTGYVTPDSYTETLQYHGVVTITARDMIGHLQDFDFDAKGNAEGMITPRELLTLAWDKAQIPMTLEWRGVGDSNIWPQTGGVDAIDTYINVSAFEGKTWSDAVTETLYSLGLVLRYVGKNIIAVSPLRRMPTQTEESVDDLQAITPRFTAYGTREFVPAVKEIAEEVSYDVTEGAEQPLVKYADFTGEAIQCPIYMKDASGNTTTSTAVVYPISNEGEVGWGNTRSLTLFFSYNRNQFPLLHDDSDDEQVYLAAFTKDRMVWYGKKMQMGDDVVLKIEQGVVLSNSNYGLFFTSGKAASLTATLKRTFLGKEEYYNGSKWATSYSQFTISFGDAGHYELRVPMRENAGGQGLLQLFITGADVELPDGSGGINDPVVTTAAYVGIKSLSFSLPQTRSLMERNKVTTKYDEANNVRMTRDPELGPAYDEVAFPALIKNAIFRKDGDIYKTAAEWVWPYEGGDAVQLAVLIHQQLLCYHSKPNNVLTGDIVNADMLDPRVIWTWKGAEHMLLSGSYNFATSRLEGAVLREFVRYEDMW